MEPSTLAREGYLDAIYRHYENYMDRTDADAARNRQPHKEPMGIVEILDRYPVTHPPSALLVGQVIGFLDVEELLPDYMKHILELVPHSAGQAQFVLTWGGEEARHAWALGKWLQAAGIWSQKERRLHTQNQSHIHWDPVPYNPDFADAYYGPIAYVTKQEKITAISYENVGAQAKKEGQEALARICRRLKRDEVRHHAFYLELSRLTLTYDFETFADRLIVADRNFKMPGEYLVSEDPEDATNARLSYKAWSEDGMREGIIPDPFTALQLKRRLRRNEKLDPLEAQQLTPIIKCWNRAVRAAREIFEQLELPIPQHLTRQPLFCEQGLPYTVALSCQTQKPSS